MKKRTSRPSKRLDALEKRFTEILLTIPNIQHESVPVGRTTAKMWRCAAGRPPFAEPKSAVRDLGQALGWFDWDASNT